MTRGWHTLACLFVLLSCAPMTNAADFAWIEGEKPASANIKFNAGGWGNKHFLSGDSWLHVVHRRRQGRQGSPRRGSAAFATISASPGKRSTKSGTASVSSSLAPPSPGGSMAASGRR